MAAWLSDANGNKCSVEYFGSAEAAQAALDSLKNCKSCTKQMTTYGQKGGEGPTRGRKAETIEAIFCGVAYRKRVFFGQRWLALSQNEHGVSVVTAWESEARANQHLLHVNGDDWPVQLIAEAKVA